MTERMVERAAPTAYRSVLVRPTGAGSLMPPHSQGAERRTAHRAGRTGSRWGLRALVIGGLAGAAWLLTGAAAHAADRDPAVGGLSLDSSLIGSAVPGDDHTIPVVDEVLKAAVQPLAPDHHRGTSDTDPDSAPSGSTGVGRESTAPLRPAGVAVDSRKSVPVGDTPDGDGPAPPRGHLGAANGVPASGPGTATEGGSAAFLPAKVADSTVAHHRLLTATDVEVRRYDAETPTVSPD